MDIIMTAKGHLFFSIACIVFIKNTELVPILVNSDWWHVVPSVILTCLLPDIDHPKSFLGQRLTWISKPISLVFGHRGFTHSLLAIFFLFIFFWCLKAPESRMFPTDVLYGVVFGYLSHILADMLTPAGVPLFWPCRWRFRLPILIMQKNSQLELILCIALFIFAIWIPKNLHENSVIRWLSQIINSLQFQFSHFIIKLKN